MKSRGRNNVFTSVLLLMLVVLAVPVTAQEKSYSNMQIFLEKMKIDKKLMVSENMQLTEVQAKAFWPIYDRYQSELFLLRARTAKLIDDYAKSYNNMTEGTAKKLLDESMIIEQLRLKLNNDYLTKFRKALPESKVARYYQIENKVNAALYYDLAANIPLIGTEK